MSTVDLDIETAKILTISTAHLSPVTRDMIEACRGNVEGGPSVAIRDCGYLINSHLNTPDALQEDCEQGNRASLLERHPDLVLIRALARGQGAEWINVDQAGLEYDDILPSYDDNGTVTAPTGEGWCDALEVLPGDEHLFVWPSYEVLKTIEQGGVPGLEAAPSPN